MGLVELQGFKLSNEITLLGMPVQKTLENTDAIFNAIKEKILKIIRMWELYRLTLPGRIAIIKTLIMPQLNYLGSFLSPSNAKLEELQCLIDRFGVQTLRVSKERLYLPCEKGGLGLFRLSSFLSAQKCAWV